MKAKSNSSDKIKDQSEDALIDILLTVDGQGKQAKAAALCQLLQWSYDKGLAAGIPPFPVNKIKTL